MIEVAIVDWSERIHEEFRHIQRRVRSQQGLLWYDQGRFGPALRNQALCFCYLPDNKLVTAWRHFVASHTARHHPEITLRLSNFADLLETFRARIAVSYNGSEEIHDEVIYRFDLVPEIADIEPMFRIDWYNSTHWKSVDTQGNIVEWEISQMQDQHLWETVCWLVQSRLYLLKSYLDVEEDEQTLMNANHWLKYQTVFRALVQEAVRRQLTYPIPVFQYLKQYVVDSQTCRLRNNLPWRDTTRSRQPEELKKFLEQPAELPDPQRDFGRDFRLLEL